MHISAAIASLSDALARSSLSLLFQETSWVVPAIQTVHILSVGAVVSSALFVTLRLLGVSARDVSAQHVARRFLPLLWWNLPILLLSGAVLIVAEPARSLQNPAFYWKMGLLLGASAVTLAYQLPLRRDAAFWQQSSTRRLASKLLSGASFSLWIGVVVAGRFIAYIGNL